MFIQKHENLSDWYNPATWFSSSDTSGDTSAASGGATDNNPADYPEPEIGPITPDTSVDDSGTTSDVSSPSQVSQVIKVPTVSTGKVSVPGAQPASGISSSMILPIAIIGGGLILGYFYMKSKQQPVLQEQAA